MRGMRSGALRLIVILAGSTTTASALPAQEVLVRPLEFVHPDEMIRGRGFAVLADRRTFAVTAFLNAVGYDEEADGVEMHPVRMRVRELMAASLRDKADLLRAWKTFYTEAGLPLFVYLDYALSLSADYPFQRIRPAEEVGYPQVLETMDRLVPLLNEFWVEADLSSVWTEVKPLYKEELGKYDFARMEEQMHKLWEYLRLPRRDTYTIINVPNLLGEHYLGIGAEYETYYYTVETPGAQSYALNTHEYLHSIVNPLVTEAFGAQSEKLTRYYEAGRDGRLAGSYQRPTTFVSECLVRALDYRLRLREAESEGETASVEARVDELSEGGLTLVRPFFDRLAVFEQEEVGFAQYVPTLLETVPELGASRRLRRVPLR